MANLTDILKELEAKIEEHAQRAGAEKSRTSGPRSEFFSGQENGYLAAASWIRQAMKGAA